MARAREEINTMKIDAHFILNYFEFMSIFPFGGKTRCAFDRTLQMVSVDRRQNWSKPKLHATPNSQ